MGWTLVVSQDEAFQKEAIARLAADRPVVGATGEATACNLVRAVDVEQILIDALDDVGRHVLGLLRGLPASRVPQVLVVDPVGRDSRFRTAPSIQHAYQDELLEQTA